MKGGGKGLHRSVECFTAGLSIRERAAILRSGENTGI